MNAGASTAVRMTPEEYLIRERAAETRSEYMDGALHAIAGGSPRHALLQTSLSALLWAKLRDRDCLAFSSDMKVWIPAKRAFFYPDLSVACNPPTYFNGDALENPSLIIEVLSPSTERFDRTRKFAMYRSIPSLRQYVLVSQDEPLVEVLTKSPEGFWIYMDYAELDSVVSFSAIGVEAPLAEIYERIVFDPAGPEESARQ
jgi:Uma2 family endonuclease